MELNLFSVKNLLNTKQPIIIIVQMKDNPYLCKLKTKIKENNNEEINTKYCSGEYVVGFL